MTTDTSPAAARARPAPAGATGEAAGAAASPRVPLKAGFLTDDLGDLGAVRFVGVRCDECGIALLGRRRRCENCSSRAVREETFASGGVVHTWTVQRYPPPPPHVGPTPWVPRAVAWIDLDHGPRIMGPLAAPVDEVRIGMRVSADFLVGWRDDQGRDVVSFLFRPEQAPARENAR